MPYSRIRWGCALLLVLLGLYECLRRAPVMTLDGYSHLYTVLALKNIWFQGNPAFAKEYLLNSPLLPNWTGTLALLGFTLLFSPETALRVFEAFLFLTSLVSFVFLFAVLAGRRFRGLLPELTCLALPFAYSTFLTFGFHGFTLGLSAAVVLIGIIIRCGARIPPAPRLLVLLLLAIVYSSNPLLSYVIVLFWIFAIAARVMWKRPPDSWVNRALRDHWADLLMIALLAGITAFGFHAVAQDVPRSSLGANIHSAVGMLMQPDAFLAAAPSGYGGILFVALIVLVVSANFAAVARLRLQELETPAIFCGSFGVMMVLLFFLGPQNIGGGSYIKERLLFLSIVAQLMFFLASGFGPKQLAVIAWCTAAPCAAAAYFENHAASQYMVAPLRELQSASRSIPPGSRILVLAYNPTPWGVSRELLRRVTPEAHFGSLAAIWSGSVLVNDYEPFAHHFPLLPRDTRAKTLLDPLDEIRPEDLSSFLRNPTSNIDEVVVWGIPTAPAWRWVEADCLQNPEWAERFQLVYHVKSASEVRVYSRR